MDILKISAIGVCIVMLSIMMKNYNGSYGVYIVIAGCAIIFYFSINRLLIVFSAIDEIQSYIKINSSYLNTFIKIIGITYIVEFVVAICKDAGYSAVASLVEMFGKLSIIAISMPVILALIKTVENLLVVS